MEPKENDSESVRFERAILKAFGDEPLLRYVCRQSNGIIMVRSERSFHKWEKGEDVDNWIGWPTHDVFRYDPTALKELQVLFSEQRTDALKNAWKSQERMFA